MPDKIRQLRPSPSAPASTRRRVLVVEDNLESVHSLALVLKNIGHEVQFAINGFAAMEVARKFRPEVILLDIGLPDVDGDNIARQLKWEPGLEKTRIIALTGSAEPELRERALEAGCAEFVVKPIDPAALETLLA